MTTRCNAPAALTALLDAQEAELLVTSKDDVQAALLETGEAKEGAIREIRSLLRDAERDSDDRYPFATIWRERRNGNAAALI